MRPGSQAALAPPPRPVSGTVPGVQGRCWVGEGWVSREARPRQSGHGTASLLPSKPRPCPKGRSFCVGDRELSSPSTGMAPSSAALPKMSHTVTDPGALPWPSTRHRLPDAGTTTWDSGRFLNHIITGNMPLRRSGRSQETPLLMRRT